MLLAHLRSNVVAYLALAVALGTGTAYAADQIANGSVTSKKLAKNAVTSPKIKANAVRSADVKNGTLTADDLATGVLPPGIGLKGYPTGDNPSATPDIPDLRTFPFTTQGRTFVQVTFDAIGADCTSGQAGVAFYLDGTAVPKTFHALPAYADAVPMTLITLLDTAPGDHTLTLGLDCFGPGTPTSSTASDSNAVILTDQ